MGVSSLANVRSVHANDDTDAMVRSGSRCVCITNASGYCCIIASKAQMCPGDLSTQRFTGIRDCRCCRNLRCHRYADAISVPSSHWA